jgi:deazaflavin-dependent oxidoreductase (nitroreductase family)
MPLPGSLARFNRVVTNRISKPLARRLPWFAVLRHRGRNSGLVYETPVNAWRDDGRIVVALTYGDDVDWLKNAAASPESVMVMGGEEIRVGPPTAIGAEDGLAAVPGVVAKTLAVIDVHEFVEFPILPD